MRRSALLALPLVLAACGSSAPQVDTRTQSRTEVNTSFNELMALGKDYSCTFSHTDETGSRQEGTVKVAAAGKRMRGEFVITSKAGEVTRGNIIRDGVKAYVWDGDRKEGMVMDIPEDEADSFEQAPVTIPEGDDAMDFMCDGWTPGSDSFAPPADIAFTDFSAQMKAAMDAMGGAEGMKAQQCAACAQIPDAAGQAECKKALGC